MSWCPVAYLWEQEMRAVRIAVGLRMIVNEYEAEVRYLRLALRIQTWLLEEETI